MMKRRLLAILLTVGFVAVGIHHLATSQIGPPGGGGGGDWLLQVTPNGQTVLTYPKWVNGLIISHTETRNWTTSPPNTQFQEGGLAQNMVAGTDPWEVSASSAGSVTVTLTWTPTDRPAPAYLFLELTGNANFHFAVGAVGGGDCDDGLHRDPVVTQGNNWIDGHADGKRYVRKPVVNGTVEFTLSMSAHASGTGYKLAYSVAGLSLNVVPSTRAVELYAMGLEPTYYRDANGIPAENERDASGCMHGDTVAAPVYDNPDPGSYFAWFDFNIGRNLLGPWHTDPDDLFNEWWRTYPYDYISDGPFSENTWMPTHYKFDDIGGQYVTVQSRKAGGPLEDVITYRATDEIDNFVAESKYFMKIHLPCERTEDEWREPYSGDLWLCPEPVGSFTPLYLGGAGNNTEQQIEYTFTIQTTASYTFAADNAVHGGIGIDVKAIKVQFGADTTHSTTENSQLVIGQTVRIPIPPHEHRYVYAHVLGSADFPRPSKYVTNGFFADGPVHVPEYTGFEIQIWPSLLY